MKTAIDESFPERERLCREKERKNKLGRKDLRVLERRNSEGRGEEKKKRKFGRRRVASGMEREFPNFLNLCPPGDLYRRLG